MPQMKALVLGIVWAFACSCCIAADVPIQPDFDATKIGGTWYPVQLVMDKGEMKDVKIFGRTVTPLDNGDLHLDVKELDNGGCSTKTIKFLHTDQPGKFTIEGGSRINVVETDYTGYLITHVETKLRNALHLEARDPQASDSIKEKFKEVAGSLGFPTDNITDMPSTGSCPS